MFCSKCLFYLHLTKISISYSNFYFFKKKFKDSCTDWLFIPVINIYDVPK